MRALWIEDHQLIGDSLQMLLQVLMPEVSLDKARSIDVAVQLAQSFRYELVLMDWWLGDVDGEHTIQALRQAQCQAPIIVVSGDERDAVVRRAQACDVVAYVTKSADPTALLAAIRSVVDVVQARPPVTSPMPVVGAFPTPSANAPAKLSLVDVYPELTSRQADVFRCLMRGISDKHIARELDISETTVKTHVRAILQLVGASKRGEAVYQARSRGAGDH
ncbi:MAG: hypothetical protein RI907_355 [Pseudomonadota bacterium]|jgi:DNA-binding NarL/FixJ family response regulator